MKRVYFASALPNERAALHTLLLSLSAEIVGESASWRNLLALAPATHPDVIVLSWGLISARATAALRELRSVCPSSVVVVTPGETAAQQRPQALSPTDVPVDRETPEKTIYDRHLADRMQVILARVW